MWLTHSGCTHGRQQKFHGDKQGDEKREKRHFQLECNLSDFLLLFTIEMQLPDVSQQPLLCLPLLHFSFHAPFERRALPSLDLAGFQGACSQAIMVQWQGWQSVNGERQSHETQLPFCGRRLAGCPSLPILQGWGITLLQGNLPSSADETRHCLMMGLSTHTWALKERQLRVIQ